MVAEKHKLFFLLLNDMCRVVGMLYHQHLLSLCYPLTVKCPACKSSIKVNRELQSSAKSTSTTHMFCKRVATAFICTQSHPYTTSSRKGDT